MAAAAADARAEAAAADAESVQIRERSAAAEADRAAAGERLTEAERESRDNRRRLFWAMSEAGFVNYPGEWWHFCYGERLWAQVTGNQPLYSHCDGAGLW